MIANIRMSVATIIVFWTPIEVIMRINLFTEIWIQPEKYKTPMMVILALFIILLAYIIINNARKKENT